ncbi:MAG: hypothetical protein AB7N24_13545 [Dehalococcoidia bacterium]
MIERLLLDAHKLDLARTYRQREQRRIWHELETIERLGRALRAARARLSFGGHASAEG